MHDGTEDKGIKNGVMEAIRSGKAPMRPQWYFALRGALIGTGALIAFCLALYLASFAVFLMNETGAWEAPLYGTDGLVPFLRAIPATLILLSLVFIAVLETLVRRHSFAYRAPLLYSLIAVLATVMTASAFVAPLHRAPFRVARHGGMRIGGQLYRRFGVGRVRNVRHGTIDGLVNNGFILRNIEDATSLVRVSPKTHLPKSMVFKIGDTVTIFGIEGDEAIEARGVRADGF